MNTHLRVAVCTNRSPSSVAEALEALRREVPAGRLVVVVSGAADGDGYDAPLVLVDSRARNLRTLARIARERSGRP